jgi:DNA polymerase-3 subunit epsilon
MDALHETTKLRQCKDKITSKSVMTPCALFEMDRCIAPCLPEIEISHYEEIVTTSKKILAGDSSQVTTKFMGSIQKYVELEKFEEAALSRDRMHALAGGVHRSSKLRSLGSIPFLLAAQLNELGGWDIHAITYGRLAGAIQAPPSQDPKTYVSQLKSTIASDVQLPTLVSETELLLKWLGDGKTRLVEISAGHTWQHPITAPVKAQELLTV